MNKLFSRLILRIKQQRWPDWLARKKADIVNLEPVIMASDSGPESASFVVMRQAMLDRELQVVGYAFAQSGNVSADDEAKRDLGLVRYVLGQEARQLVGTRQTFLSLTDDVLYDAILDEMGSAGMTLLFRFASQTAKMGAKIERLAALKQRGFLIGLMEIPSSLEMSEFAQIADIVFFPVSNILPPDLLQQVRQLKKTIPAIQLGAHGVDTLEEFDVCRRLGFRYFSGPFVTRRGDWSQNAGDTATLGLCDLLARMRKGAEITEIAEQIKLDPLLSFRILRLGNSPAMGVAREITSIKDAAMLLGREYLYRWLVMILCASGPTEPGHHLLLESALARGRFMELLAAEEWTPAQRESLFLTGMFSLLDVLLKMELKTLVERLKLPEEVRCAILDHKGPCAPLLKLAEACEKADEARIVEQCRELEIDNARLNQAQADAACWARAAAEGVAG